MTVAQPTPMRVMTAFGARNITKPIFADLISKLGSLDETKGCRVTHAGLIATGLVRSKARWADAALLGMLAGAHGLAIAEDTAEAITGEPSVVTVRRASRSFTCEAQSFGQLCLRHEKFLLLKAIAEFDGIMTLAGREFHAAVNGTTDAGRILDTISAGRQSFLSMAIDWDLLSSCAVEHPLACVQLLMDVDSEHPDLFDPKDPALRTHVAEERKRRHALATEQMMRDHMPAAAPEPVTEPATRSRRSLGI